MICLTKTARVSFNIRMIPNHPPVQGEIVHCTWLCWTNAVKTSWRCHFLFFRKPRLFLPHHDKRFHFSLQRRTCYWRGTNTKRVITRKTNSLMGILVCQINSKWSSGRIHNTRAYRPAPAVTFSRVKIKRFAAIKRRGWSWAWLLTFQAVVYQKSCTLIST